MKWRNRLKAAALGLGLVLSGAATAEGYTNHARVSFDAGSNLVKGSDDKDWSHATVNTLLLPGDTLWVDEGGTSELEFSGGTFLRGADGSKVELYALPPTALFRAWNGSMYVQRLERSGGDVTMESPAAKIYIEPNTLVRVDIVDSGATTISVRQGRVLVKAADGNGAVTVDVGERVWADPGMLPSEPTPFNMSQEDALDSWNRERMALLAGGGRSVPKEVIIRDETIGVSDLSNHGEWVYVENRHVWRPTVVVNYVPYRYGYWNHVPTIGDCWVDNYPFSYVTSHYGRWHNSSRYGWVWSYDPVWSPAWVATIRCGDYYAWTPIGYDYRPVSYGGARFSVGGVDFFIGATSYVPVNYFGYGPRYVYGCYPEFGNYVRHTTVNIWNINYGGGRDRDHIRVPYNTDLPVDRDYTPRRSIRGLDSIDDNRSNGGGRSVVASERVRSLEGRMGRTSFASNKEPGVRDVRTVNAPEGREANVRRVSLREERTADPIRRATSDKPATIEPRVGRAADATSGRPADVEERPRVAGREDGTREEGGREESSRERGGRESGVRDGETPTLTNDDARGARPVAGDRSRRPTIDGPSTTDSEPSLRGGEAVERGRTRGESGNSRVTVDGPVDTTTRPGTPSRGDGDDARGVRTPSVDTPRTRTVESDSEGGLTGTRGRSATPRRTEVPQDQGGSRAPAVTIRGRTPSGPSVDDVPTRRRSDSGYQSAPSTRTAPEPQSAPRTVERSAPRGSSAERPSYVAPDRDSGSSRVRTYQSEPSVQRSAPREVQREAPRQVQREAPSYQAPRQVQREAPRYEAPRREAAPRVEAPREMNVPTIQRSAPSNSRGSEPRMESPRGGGSRGDGAGSRGNASRRER